MTALLRWLLDIWHRVLDVVLGLIVLGCMLAIYGLDLASGAWGRFLCWAGIRRERGESCRHLVILEEIKTGRQLCCDCGRLLNDDGSER